MYEFVFAATTYNTPFTIIQVVPYREFPVSKEITIKEFNLVSACVLTVIAKEDSPDPLLYLDAHHVSVVTAIKQIMCFK